MASRNSTLRLVESLYRDAHDDLKSFVQRRVGRADASEVEDIVQESFLRMSSQADGETLRNPRSFLFRIARNLIVDVVRRRSVRSAWLESERLATDTGSRAEGRSPERYVESRQELELILAAIADLPPACRNVFLLQRQHGLSYAELAERLGISESMVQKHMSKALFHLYKVLP